MNSEAAIKGTIVFALTFGMFVIAKQNTPTKQSAPTTTQTPDPVEPTAALDAQTSAHPATEASSPATESTERPTKTSTDNSVSTVPSSDVATGVKDTLTKWANAISSNNPELESSCYAPTLTTYFDQSNVDNDAVKATKQSFINQGNRVTNFGLEQVRMDDATPSSATVHLIKDVTWQNATGVQIQKKIGSTLTLQSFSDGWKITSERNVQ